MDENTWYESAPQDLTLWGHYRPDPTVPFNNWQQIKSSFNQVNPIRSRFAYDDDDTQPLDKSWSVARYINEMDVDDEERLKLWMMGWNTRSQDHFEKRRENRRKEEYDREVMASRGFWEGLAYDMGGSVIDPIVLTSAVFLGPMAIARGAASSAARSALLVGGEVAIQEGLLMPTQSMKTIEESKMAVVGSMVFGSILGGLGGAFYKGFRADGGDMGSAQVIADTINDIQRNQALDVALPPRDAPWEAPGPPRAVDESNLTPEQVSARINADNDAFFPEGGSLARWMKMHYMTDAMAGQLFRGPFGRRIMGAIVSLDGFLPANFKGRARDPISPAEPAIERAQNEFGREFHDFFAESMMRWADHTDQSLAQRIIGEKVNDTDVIEHTTRFGELYTVWAARGRDIEVLADLKLTSGERGDYRWMEDQLKKYDTIQENYTYWQINNGGFKADFNELLFNDRKMGIAEAEARIAELKEAEAKDAALDREADFRTERERNIEDRKLAKENEGTQKALDNEGKAFDKDIKDTVTKREQARQQILRNQAKELEEFDQVANVNKSLPIKRRDYKGQLPQEKRIRNIERSKEARRKLLTKHEKELKKFEAGYKKTFRDKYKDFDKRTNVDRIRMDKQAWDTQIKRENADKKTQNDRLNGTKGTNGGRKREGQLKRMWEADRLTKGIDQMRRIEEGDMKFAYDLTKRFNGEDYYRPQIISRERMRELGKDTFIESMIRARASWLTNNIKKDYATDFDKTKWTEELEKLRLGSTDPSVNQKYSDMYDYLLDESNLDNNFQSFSDMRTTARPSNFYKKREYKFDQSMMMDFMENDIQYLMGAHIRSVVPELVLRQRGLWDAKDIAALKKEAYREVENQIEMIRNDPSLSNRQKTSQVKSWKRDYKRLDGAIDNTLRTLRNDDFMNSKQWQKDTVYVLNVINGMRTLGTVLPSSITDVPQAMGKVGGRYLANQMMTSKAEWEAALNGATKEDLTKFYGLFEYGQGNTITKIMESDEIGPNQSSFMRRLGRAQSGFYHSTLIIKWNQGFKENAALGFAHRVLDAALGTGEALTKKDLAMLARDGWDAEKLAILKKVYKKYGVVIPGPDGKDSGAKIINHHKIREDIKDTTPLTKTDREQLQQLWRVSEDFATAMNTIAYRAVVTPGAADLPDMAKHSVFMKLLFSLKTFNLSSLNKTTLPTIGAVKNGDSGMAAYAIAATGMGTLSYMIRQKIYDREITENPQTLFWEGFNRSGMLGIYNQGLTITQMLTGNFFGLGDALKLEVPSRYYARGAITDLLGPSVGLLESGLGVVNVYSRSIKGEEVSDSEYAKAYRLMPFNNLFYLRAAFERMSE